MKALVTGAGGFLGGAITRQLLDRGVHVRSLARGHYPDLDALGVEQLRGDAADPDTARRAAAGMDAVFHVAGKAGAWGPWDDYHRANVLTADALLDACRRLHIPHLIYTSSPSVVFTGHDLEGVDESTPYPTTYTAHYPRSKAIAERAILAANTPDGLATVALRPHLIWGPGDTNLVPRIVQRARAGQLIRISGPPRLIDTTYIDDAARAHLLAWDRLRDPHTRPQVAGKPYFIASGQPIEVWTMIHRILQAAHLPPPTRAVPKPVALAIAATLEAAWTLLRRQDEPRITRWVVHELASSHWFNLDNARRDLGYQAQVPLDEGMQRLEAWLNPSP